MFILDSNIFITAKNSYYGFDFVPGFWTALIQAHANGEVFSVKAVFDELQQFGDDLSVWAKQPAVRSFFLQPDQSTINSIATISQWSTTKSYTATAQREFLGVADLPLVAQAHAHTDTVVTLEKSEPLSKKRVHIPDVCADFNVPCISPYEMLRRLGVQLN